MWLQVNAVEIDGAWMVVIEGQARTSYTLCQTEGQAQELAYIAKMNPTVAEKLHGCRD